MASITKESFEEFVKKEFPGRKYRWEYKDGHGFMYIQAGTGKKFSDSDIHYEYYDGQVRIHIEGNNWNFLRQNLTPIFKRHPELRGEVWQKRPNCQWILNVEEIDIFEMFRKLQRIVDDEIVAFENGENISNSKSSNEYVEFEDNVCLEDVFKKNLVIPSYQRIYTWRIEHVKTLIDDIISIKNDVDYHIGDIILHELKDNDSNYHYDIVDGQQRLVTLSLINNALGLKDENLQRFLSNKYESKKAIKNIYDNCRFIEEYLNRKDRKEILRSNINKLCLSILIIKGTNNLDLAFTFFSNTNSRGKKLTDYDLLKPHHLRYIPSEMEDQQRHLAMRWDAMINSQKSKEKFHHKEIDYIRLMELCLYRLRKWSSWDNENLSIDHYIKKEFEAAPIIEEVPPFGELFNYNEPIQGGQHFFAYVDFFLEKYKTFDIKDVIHANFGYDGSFSWYGNVIESLIFCYYIRFGTSYINEASLSIIRYISVIRFNKGRAYEPTILNWALKSKIPVMIERASSPTFFLADIEKKIESITEDEDAVKGIRKNYYNLCRKLCEHFNNNTSVKFFNNYFESRYGKIRANA